MRFKFRRGRPSLREQITSINAAHRFYAAASDKPDAVERTERELVRSLPPKRDRVRRPVDGLPAMPLERDVLAEVMKALKADPRVAFVDRRQSGLFQDGDRYIRVGQRGVLDISGCLRGGRYFEFEVKRAEKPGPNPLQKERIWLVTRSGGVSGYCWSVESALALLP